ncbi:hypothetical protein BJ165DRAFT_1611801 [Panaeolus papilionaceus]|nr:hypothetical protein BJ165DRAFT_1611801 [Panaeolus papilionaceus]
MVQQYAEDPNAVVIAASDKIAPRVELGDRSAMIECAEVDLSQPKKQLSEAIRVLDKQYGPIAHLYEVGAVLNNLKDSTPCNLDTQRMININISGTTTAILTMYALRSDKGLQERLHLLPPCSRRSSSVDVVNIQPRFTDSRMTQKMRSQRSTIPGQEFVSPDTIARKMMKAVDDDGVGIVT